MIRIFGAALIIGGASAWGLFGVFRLRRRVAILAEFLRAIGTIRCELQTRLTPVPQLISQLTHDCAEPVAGFFTTLESRLDLLGERTLFELWSVALEQSPQLALTMPERAALCDVARALGRYDLAEQNAALTAAERELDRFRLNAEAQFRTDSKTRAVMGFSAGIFVVLMLF